MIIGEDEEEKSSTSDNEDFALFTEPADFRPPPPPPTTAQYRLPVKPYTIINLSLVGSHPLWAHHLWNAAPTLCNYLCQTRINLCKDKNVLELGAAAGLPSIISHHLGASKVVTTDYPDQPLIQNLQKNIDDNISIETQQNCIVEGYIWGKDCTMLKSHLDASRPFFDLVIMSDLIFNHQAHGAMLDTMDACLPSSKSHMTQSDESTRPQALVFFTHHRPHLADKDMQFFREAEERGWTCRELGKWKMPVS